MILNKEKNEDLFKWQTYFNTGIKDVDSQHHKLVDLINEFGYLLTKDILEHKKIEKIFNQLISYSLSHFAQEEEEMFKEKIDNRHFILHKEEHSFFINEVKYLYSQTKQENIKNSQFLLEFLINWLSFHILGVDQVMALQIKEIKSGKTPEQAYESNVSIHDKKTKALLSSLNTLFRQVGERNRELTALNISFEKKVKERTHELLEANKHLELLSLTDTLTSLSNRRHAMILLEKQFIYAKDNKTSLSCLMIDVDNFKEVNDNYGHEAGDEILRVLTEIFLNTFRIDDNICRFGGDEFLILCPKTNLKGAILIAERVRNKIKNLELKIWNSSISIGISTVTEEMDNHMPLIRKADELLYISKENGKNKVSF